MVETDGQESWHSGRNPDMQILCTRSGIGVFIGFIPTQKVKLCGTCLNRFFNRMNEQQHARGISTVIFVVTRTVKRDDAAVVEAINSCNIDFPYRQQIQAQPSLPKEDVRQPPVEGY